MNNIGQRFLNEINLDYEDKGHFFKKLIQNPNDFLTWDDVEYCINKPELFEFELIDKYNNKIEIPVHKKTWIYYKPVYDKQFIIDHVNSGCTLVIPNYGSYSNKTYELCNTFEKLFDVHAAIHVYCGLSGSQSFSIHDDYPANVIIQVEGKTRWKIFKNRISYMYRTGRMNNKLTEDQLEVEIDVELEPGDALYIPSRAYHVAYPTEKRLSMSIPCWNRIPTDPPETALDRRYYKING